ncbi:hypothetical protein [Parachlamydia sp. AcF125]|uniref:hypothetical protein n=1 Tax=Parachlamydia sp. AcF125 TaxID=2795736 RepID=UPI001BC91818|nr:hypothetical protein [Parachlamydia sp. AcF125]MBS4169135.1 hypothetical protein [Parachlamydia sp. AcF125]
MRTLNRGKNTQVSVHSPANPPPQSVSNPAVTLLQKRERPSLKAILFSIAGLRLERITAGYIKATIPVENTLIKNDLPLFSLPHWQQSNL